MKNNFKDLSEYPSILDVNQVSEILNISKAKSYSFFNSFGFPILKLEGKLKRVKKDDFIEWLDRKVNKCD